MMYKVLFYLFSLLYVLGLGIVFLPSKDRVFAHKLGSMFSGVASALAFITGLIFILAGNEYLALFKLGFFLDFAIDRLSAFFLVIIGVAGTIASAYAYAYGLNYTNDKLKLLTAQWSTFLFSMSLVVLSYNALSFLFAWEIMAIASFLLVNHEQYKKITWQAAYQYILMTNLGTAFIIAAFFMLASQTLSLDFNSFIFAKNSIQNSELILLLALVGFATKAGLVPMHIWLPNAHPIAPTHVSALMSGVMLKMAVYGFLRFTLDFLGRPEFYIGVATLFLGLLSGFLGALFLQVQTDMKKILAYSSIEHLGIIFSAIGAGLIFASAGADYAAYICYLAALIHSLNHSFIKTALFLIAGSVIHNTHTRNIEHMGGLINYMPITAACTLIASMSICALPFTGGFLGEWLLVLSLLKIPELGGGYSSVVGTVAVIFFGFISALSLGGFVRFFGIVFLGKTRAKLNTANISESPFITRPIMAATALCLISGVFAAYIANFASVVLGSKFDVAPSIGVLNVYTTAFSPLLLVLLLLVLMFALYKSLNIKQVTISKEVWSCGIYPTARMQYSAIGFSKPVRRIFAFYLQPNSDTVAKQVKIVDGKKVFVPANIKDVISDKLYNPLQAFLIKASGMLRRLQAGGVQLYVSYILITTICVLIYGAR